MTTGDGLGKRFVCRQRARKPCRAALATPKGPCQNYAPQDVEEHA